MKHEREEDIYRDKRRLLQHRAKNCECWKCSREMSGLGPLETDEERIASYKFEEREIKRAKKAVAKEVKAGKQHAITTFFKQAKKS